MLYTLNFYRATLNLKNIERTPKKLIKIRLEGED